LRGKNRVPLMRKNKERVGRETFVIPLERSKARKIARVMEECDKHGGRKGSRKRAGWEKEKNIS